MSDIYSFIASRTGISDHRAKAALDLLDDGATVPFISRYRKECTGGLDEVQIRSIETLAASYRELEKSKAYVSEVITAAGAMTAELQAKIADADQTTIEDLYLPFKPRRRTRATIARERGLEPLARIIMSGNARSIDSIASRYVKGEVSDVSAAIEGASDIIAEWVSENARARDIVRSRFRRNAELHSCVVKGKENEARNYRNYFDFRCRVSRIPSHNYLAIRRAERESLLKVSMENDDVSTTEALVRYFVRKNMSPEISGSSAMR